MLNFRLVSVLSTKKMFNNQRDVIKETKSWSYDSDTDPTLNNPTVFKTVQHGDYYAEKDCRLKQSQPYLLLA